LYYCIIINDISTELHVYTLPSDTIVNGAVGSSEIAVGAVDRRALANGSITNRKLAEKG
jgi:hypothetical protein